MDLLEFVFDPGVLLSLALGEVVNNFAGGSPEVVLRNRARRHGE